MKQRRKDKYELTMRLGRMRARRLWRFLNCTTFERYAVKVGAASSPRAARQLADLADQLAQLPILHRVFATGAADWTKIREAAPAALLNPATEADWASEIVLSTYEEVKTKAQIAQGLTPTERNAVELPRDLNALYHHLWDAVGEKRGVRLTKVQFVRHLLLTTLRVEAGLVAVADGTGAEAEAVEAALGPSVARAAAAVAAEDADGSKGKKRKRKPRAVKATPVPGPSALFTAFECKGCGTAEVDARSGPVPLSRELKAELEDDAFEQDAEGKVTRRIPDQVRRWRPSRRGRSARGSPASP